MNPRIKYIVEHQRSCTRNRVFHIKGLPTCQKALISQLAFLIVGPIVIYKQTYRIFLGASEAKWLSELGSVKLLMLITFLKTDYLYKNNQRKMPKLVLERDGEGKQSKWKMRKDCSGIRVLALVLEDLFLVSCSDTHCLCYPRQSDLISQSLSSPSE